MPIALFGIEDGSLNLAVNLLLLLLVVVWLSLIYWTFADARRRIADPVLITTATVASLVPFIGTVIYSILRPPEYLEDVREREIETQASELRMRHLMAQSCPRCEHPIERSWLRCPECQHRLKDPCRSCNRPVDPRWSVCPYCETPMRRKSSPDSSEPRKRPRSGSSSSRSGDSARSERESGGSRRSPAAESGSRERSERPERPERTERPPRTERPQPAPPSSRTPATEGGEDGTSSRPRRRSTTSPS